MEEKCKISIEGVSITLYSQEDSLVLILLDSETGNLVKSFRFNKYDNKINTYSLEDISSGTSDKGIKGLSFAVVEEDDSMDMPHVAEFAMYIYPDGKYEEVLITMWSNSETHSYYEYNKEKQSLELFFPKRPY